MTISARRTEQLYIIAGRTEHVIIGFGELAAVD